MCNVRSFRVSALGIAALCMVCAMAQAQEPMKVGEHYVIHVDSRGSSDAEGMSTATGRVYEITHPGATFMSVHFARFDLAPGDFMIVSDANGGQSYVLEGKGKMNAGTFWSQHVKGDTIVLELVTTGNDPGKGFVINKYGAGFVNLGPGIERICGLSDFENAICHVGSTEYDEAKAVARLLIQSMWLCTGWLASANSHLITNEHCITSATEALNTDYEFMSEAPNCNDPNCQLCYTGDIFSGGVLIKDDAALDYSLVQVYTTNGDPALLYGYLEIDNREAIVGEVIYHPQHPAGRAKEFGYWCDTPSNPGVTQRCWVESITEPGCSSASYNDVGYWTDTEGGSSGSPVLAVSSHGVIALHHCHNYCDLGGAPNRGVPINLICPEIEAYIPSCATGYCGDGTCGAGEDQCNCPEDCGDPPPNEVPNSTCQDGLDNDCDTYTDCDDADCDADPACICNDNGVCEEGEDCYNCPGDCISGGGEPGCGNGTCEPGEDCNSCPDDCRSKTTGAPSGRYCCDGDLENCGNPKCSEDGWLCGSAEWYCCGEDGCTGMEDSCNCALDCGPPPSTEVGLCDNGQDDDCDGPADCDDSDCAGDPACVCGETGAPCTSNDDCCKSCDKKTWTCR